jgi:tetratricopeptide (TPR) repeat protein
VEFDSLPFVDRAGLLASLRDRVRRTVDPVGGKGEEGQAPPKPVFIKAAEGAGKGRLMNELRIATQADGVRFHTATSAGDGVSVLGGVGKMVLEIAEGLGEESKSVAGHGPLLRRIESGAFGTEDETGLINFLLTAAGEEPFVLHIGELERGGESIRLLVDGLVRGLAGGPVPLMLCLTSAPHFKVERLLTSLLDEQLAQLWSLPTFSAEELASLVEAAFGSIAGSEDLAELLATLTGGEPFAVQEALRALVEEEILVEEDERWTYRVSAKRTSELERLLAGRVEARLDAQGAGAWELASILYLMNSPVVVDHLAELTDLRRSRFDRLLARLEESGLVARGETPDGETVMLAHQSIREAVRARSLDSLDERRLELAAGLEELGLDSPKFIALRCELIDDAADTLESVEVLTKAAEELLDQGQTRLGAGLLERVIRRLRNHGGAGCLRQLLDVTMVLFHRAYGTVENPRHEEIHYQSGALLAQLLADHRAEALLWLGLSDRFAGGKEGVEGADVALERLAWAARAAGRAGDRGLQLRVAGRRAETLLQDGRVNEAEALSAEAIEILELDRADDVDVCNIVGVRIRCLAFLGEFEEAFRLREIGRPIAARLPLTKRRTYLSGMSFLCTLSGQYERGLEELEDVVLQTRAADTPRLLISPLHNLGDLYLRLERNEEAADCFREALRLCKLFRMPSNAALNLGFLGYAMAFLSKIDEGAEMLRDATELARKIEGAHVTLIQLQLLEAEVRHMGGDTDGAKADLEKLIRQFRRANETSYVKLANEALARIARDEDA